MGWVCLHAENEGDAVKQLANIRVWFDETKSREQNRRIYTAELVGINDEPFVSSRVGYGRSPGEAVDDLVQEEACRDVL